MALAILTTLICLVVLHEVEGARTWTATHWVFTYEHGVIKRGLVGTVLAQVLGPVTVPTVTFVYLGFAALATVLLAAGLWVALAAKTQSRLLAAALAVCILTSPGTVQQWLHDIGRFDVFGFILLCLSCAVILRASPTVGLFAAFLGSTLAILIHEAFFFWVGPMCLAVWHWKHRALAPAVGAALVLVGLTAWISASTYGRLFEFDTAKEMLQSDAAFALNDNSLRVQFRGLTENITYTAARAWVPERWMPLAFAAAYLSAMVAFMLWLIRQDIRRNALLVVACFAPLGLLFLGHDHGRWAAMVACNLSLALLCWLHAGPARPHHPIKWCFVLLIFCTAVHLMVGPFGVTEMFPERVLWSAP